MPEIEIILELDTKMFCYLVNNMSIWSDTDLGWAGPRMFYDGKEWKKNFSEI